MSRTAAALALVLGTVFTALYHVTLGFRTLTSEEARRIRVAEAPVAISSLTVIGPDRSRTNLWSADPQARAWLVTFIYTRCPSICAALGSEFGGLQAQAQAAGVRLASLSFDRVHDTPEALTDYAKRHHADPERWLVALPESDASLARLLKEMGVVAIDDGVGGYTHNAAIHVVTPTGKLVALFDLDHYAQALAFARQLP